MTTLQTALTVATAVTASGTLAAGKHTPVDATSGALTMTLPTPATIGARLRVEKLDGTVNAVTVSGTIRGTVSAAISLTTQYESREFFAESLTSWRPAADHRTKSSLDNAYAQLADAHDMPSGGTAFSRTVLDAPTTGTSKYSSFPAIVDTLAGSLVVIFRRAGQHNSNPGNPGVFYRMTSRDGRNWTPATLLFADATFDLRDPCLTRFPGERRIWLTHHKTTVASTTAAGLYLRYSDDDGATFSAPIRIGTDNLMASAAPLRRSADGTYLMTAYRDTGTGFWRASLCSSTNPTVAASWTVADVYVTAGNPAPTEWDVVEISPTNTIGVMRRNNPDSALAIVQSTDGRATWSAPVFLSGVAFPIGNGWPRLYKLDDGRVLCAYRSSGGGLRIIQLLDTANPLTVANWTDPYRFPAVGLDGTLVSTAKLEAVKVGAAWRAVYWGEDPGDNTVASVRYSEFTEAGIGQASSFIATNETVTAATTPYVTLTTPDRVQVLSPGCFYDIEWEVQSLSAATIENWNAAIYIDGVFQSDSTQLAIGATTQNVANSSYYNGKRGSAYLAAGLHTIELRFRVQTGTTGRQILNRWLNVRKHG